MATGRPDPQALVAAFALSDFSKDDNWQEAVEQDKAPDEYAIPEPDAEGNYRSPVLARVVAAYASFSQGGDQSLLLEALAHTRAGVERLLDTMELAVQEGLDDPENPIHQSSQAGFDMFLNGLDDLEDAVRDGSELEAQNALTTLQDGTNRIMDAFAFFQKLRNVLMTVHCPACGAENRRGSAKCSACGTNMPHIEERQDGRTVAMNSEGIPIVETAAPLTTPNYQRLEVALQGWQSRELNDDALRAEIDAVETNMAGHRKANASELEDLDGLTEQEQEVTVRILGAIEAALEGSLAALAEMKLYWEDGDPDHLRRGFSALAGPTQRMIDAFLAMQAISVDEEFDEGEEEE